MGRLLFEYFDSTAYRQWARPASDVAAGSWTPSSGASLYAMIDEEMASDVDYIRSSTAPSNDACTVALTEISDPTTGTVTIWIRGRFV